MALGNGDQVFLVIDSEIVYELDKEDCVLGLLSSFFIFNICYTKGCSNMYTVLEFLLFDSSPMNVSPSVSLFLANIKS